jgi:hypothetical protein
MNLLSTGELVLMAFVVYIREDLQDTLNLLSLSR